MDLVYKIATTRHEFEDAKKLFLQYANSLSINLSFQDFEGELNSLEIQYSKPTGALVLAYAAQTPIGCAGVRKLAPDTAELKRMFVHEDYRGKKVGVKLLEKCIETATALAYKKIRLDTLPDMQRAQELYRTFGFYEIGAYRYNPVRETIFMEKLL
jgi:putative acetyltransferase